MSAPAAISRPQSQAVIPVSRQSNRITDQVNTVTPGASQTIVVTETIQLVLPVRPGATVRIPHPGISYYFEFVGTTGGVPNNFSGLSVRVIRPGRPANPIIHVQGTGVRFGTAPFTSIEVTNLNNANTVLFTIDIGGGVPNQSYDEYIDKRVIISNTGGSSVTVVTAPGAPIAVQNETTVAVAFTTRTPGWADSLAGGATQQVTDGYLGRARKSIIFANDDNVAILTVLDAAGNILGSIQPATSWTTDTGGTITLKNPSGGAVTCHIGEIYYT